MTALHTKVINSGFLDFGSSSWICKEKPHGLAEMVSPLMLFNQLLFPLLFPLVNRCVGFKINKIIFPLANAFIIKSF